MRDIRDKDQGNDALSLGDVALQVDMRHPHLFPLPPRERRNRCGYLRALPLQGATR